MARARFPRPRPAWLALGLSVAVHGLLVLAALLTAAADQAPSVGTTPAVAACVLVSNEQSGGGPAPGGAEETEESPGIPVTLPEPPPSPVQQATPLPQSANAAAAGLSGPGGGSGTGGGPAIFQVEGRGESVVYVIDRSSSMGLNGGFSAARRELLASLARLPASVRFQVIVYNRDAVPLRLDGRSELLPATDALKDEAARLLGGLMPAGKTDHLEALRRGLALEPDVLFLVTDADDLTPQQVRAVTLLNQGRTAIHAIELSGRGGDGGPLEALAHDNHGTYRRVNVAQ